MLARILVQVGALVVAALITVPLVLGQRPGNRRARHKAGQFKQKASKPEAARTLKDLDSLVGALKARGLSVGRADGVSQPFFSVEGRALTVDGENVQVFQYPTAEAARKEAARVSPDGSGVGTSMMSWVGPPHFYRKDNLIVIYVGDNSKVTGALRSSLGTQFAGR